MMKRIAVIGSTGSIGVQTLEVALERGYEVTALAAGSRIDLLEQQILRHRPRPSGQKRHWRWQTRNRLYAPERW